MRTFGIDSANAIFASLAGEKKTNPVFRVGSASEFAELRHRKDRV